MALMSAQDILDVALGFAGESIDHSGSTVSEYRTKALIYLNRLQLGILAGSNEFEIEIGEPFRWAVEAQPKKFSLMPSLSFTASVTNNSTTVVLSTTPSMNLLGRLVKFASYADYYRVAAHTGTSTTITLDTAFIGTTSAANGMTAYALEYSLGTDILRICGPLRINSTSYYDGSSEILGSDMSPMLREYQMQYLRTRFPDRFAIKSVDSATNEMIIRVNTDPIAQAIVEFDYIKYPPDLTDSGSSYPKCPGTHRMMLAYGVAYYLCVDKNDSRAQNYYVQVQAGLKSLVAAEKNQRNSSSWLRGALIARPDQFKRRSAPWWWGW